jgi:non-homologous end joining protein Ku
MTGEFDPAGHHDRYRDQLEDLVRHKATGRPTDPINTTSPVSPADLNNPASPASYPRPTNVTDLTELLRASLATAR